MNSFDYIDIGTGTLIPQYPDAQNVSAGRNAHIILFAEGNKLIPDNAGNVGAMTVVVLAIVFARPTITIALNMVRRVGVTTASVGEIGLPQKLVAYIGAQGINDLGIERDPCIDHCNGDAGSIDVFRCFPGNSM